MKPRFKTKVLEGEHASFVELFSKNVGLRCHGRRSFNGGDYMEIFITHGGKDRHSIASLGIFRIHDPSGLISWQPIDRMDIMNALNTAFPIDKEAKA